MMPVVHNLKTKYCHDTSLTKSMKETVIEDLQAHYTDPSVLKLLSTATFTGKLIPGSHPI